MATGARLIVGVLGALMIVGGVVGIAAGSMPEGVWAILIGCVAIVAVAFERSRYRSAASERSVGDLGKGGGEPSRPTPPFNPTNEVFVDPTSGHRLRVYLNPATGERRYFAEDDSTSG